MIFLVNILRLFLFKNAEFPKTNKVKFHPSKARALALKINEDIQSIIKSKIGIARDTDP